MVLPLLGQSLHRHYVSYYCVWAAATYTESEFHCVSSATLAVRCVKPTWIFLLVIWAFTSKRFFTRMMLTTTDLYEILPRHLPGAIRQVSGA